MFSWIPLCRQRRAAAGGRRRGFDPCSPGCRSAGRRRSVASRKDRPSFDPCSPGYRSAGSVGRDERQIAHVSILVLLDAALPVAPVRGRLLQRRHVSILVLLDAALPARPSWFAHAATTGFDPCSPGYALPGGCRCDDAPAAPGFRSLFSWMPLCRMSTQHILAHRRMVSILVLLDTALPDARRHPPRRCPRCFDPCSPGYCSAGARRRDGVVPCDADVSILVLLDAALPGPHRRHLHARQRVSILVLLDAALPARPALMKTARWSTSFDPCSPGSALSVRPCTGRSHCVKGFRSLFSWILLCRFMVQADERRRCRCFDPCSPGCCSAGRS